MMKILKASAGSGKTFNLARTYISLLLGSEDRYAYRHILAVTFTNKATAEMKSRILKELYVMSTSPEESDYFNDFVPSLAKDAAELEERAHRVLVDILHDYSAFSVSTIDKFFQMTLKAFSREIGHFSSYQVELDRNSLIHESVDRILDSLTEDQTELIDWLNGGVMDQLRRGNRVNIEKNLYDMAEKLKSEEFRERSELLGIDPLEVFSKENLESVRKECEAVIPSFENAVREAAAAAVRAMETSGVPLGESNRGFLKKLADYADLQDGTPVSRPTDAFLRKAGDSEQWFAKSKAEKYMRQLAGALDEPLAAFVDLFGDRFKVYNTALLLKEQTFSLGLAGHFYREFEALLKEKNVLGIDDSNTILRDIIDGSDAPFVYEKLGVRFENFLLDEFQDTSTIQWQNFYPLLKESVSSGRSNLVVGDVKQSIYRWRGSDWNLLNSILPSSFPGTEVEPLDSNWRSCRSIVDFNNHFFKFAAQRVGEGELYSDVEQEVKSKDKQGGKVTLKFCAKDEELQAVLDSVREAFASGAYPGDVAVLVRKNSEGAETAAFLMENGISVLSDDSLDVKSSVVVRRLVSLLSCVENPKDTVSSYLAASLDISFPQRYESIVDLCEELLRSLRENDPVRFEGETLFIQSFMDMVQEWSSNNGQNLQSFLKYWAESKPRYISSPEDSNSVRIVTIHKSKGLEYPYVIFPYAESVEFFRSGCHWCNPKDADDSLPSVSGSVFPVDLSGKSGDTLFSEDYLSEKRMQTVDNINTLYVALTRAEKVLDVIACRVPDSLQSGGEPKDFSQLLYLFAKNEGYMTELLSGDGGPEVFVSGEDYDFSLMERKEGRNDTPFRSEYGSFPLAGRLSLSTDAADYFGEDGSVGAGASPRRNGLVLHDILSSVDGPEDLRAAVDAAVMDGRLTSDEGMSDYELLKSRIDSAVSRGWFASGSCRVVNEVTVFDTDGTEHRPDRVLAFPDRTLVIDYKFGEHRNAYKKQVARYVDLYKRMGYPSVSGVLWYVPEDSVEPVG